MALAIFYLHFYTLIGSNGTMPRENRHSELRVSLSNINERAILLSTEKNAKLKGNLFTMVAYLLHDAEKLHLTFLYVRSFVTGKPQARCLCILAKGSAEIGNFDMAREYAEQIPVAYLRWKAEAFAWIYRSSQDAKDWQKARILAQNCGPRAVTDLQIIVAHHQEKFDYQSLVPLCGKLLRILGELAQKNRKRNSSHLKERVNGYIHRIYASVLYPT